MIALRRFMFLDKGFPVASVFCTFEYLPWARKWVKVNLQDDLKTLSEALSGSRFIHLSDQQDLVHEHF